jgi:peptidase E
MGRTIVAGGGKTLGSAVDDFLLELGGPRICFVPTALGDAHWAMVAFYESFGHRAEASHAAFHPWPREDLREHILTRDVVYVAGGSMANMLAIWREHGFDAVLREAWEAGVVLAGWSAGMMCWFEAGITDSYGPELREYRGGLGFLPGSACPHYDGEEQRRPVYSGLVRNGFPPGYAADDHAALVFDGTELREVVTAREGATAYRVEPTGETALEARLL